MEFENEKIYIHRERGSVVISEQEAKKIFIKVSRREKVKFSDFVFSVKDFTKNNHKESNFSATPVFIYRKNKYFGRLHWVTGKIIFNTTKGLNKELSELEDCFLKKNIIKKPFEIKHSYVEICTRFPREAYSSAFEKMGLIKKAFRTQQTHSHIKEHDSIGEPYLYLIKKLVFNEYWLNLKIYLAVKFKNGKYSPDKIIGEDLKRQPKIEVQISKIDNLEIAKKEAIPIVLAFLDSIGTSSLEMIESDYELIRINEKHLKAYQQILAQLSFRQEQFNLFFYEKKVIEIICRRKANLLQEIARNPLSKKEIVSLYDISKNTVESDLKALKKHNLIYSRGRNGIPKMYAFDWVSCRNNITPETLPE